MSTSSSNLSALSRISSTSSSPGYNAVPSLEVVGTSSRLSPSPLSSYGCTPRGLKCGTNNDGKTIQESAKTREPENTETLIQVSNINIHSKRPKSSSASEMGNLIFKNDFQSQAIKKVMKYKETCFKPTNERNNKEQSDSPTEAISPSRMSPSKRGARRIRSREIIEELQIQVKDTFYLLSILSCVLLLKNFEQ
jgi:hypothetical protein